MLKLGIIGAGRIGKVHAISISNFVTNAVVKTIADPFITEETEKWAKSIGIENVSKDYHDILNDPEIEAVLICSSTNTHSPISIEAAKKGKHIFCEKPVDHDLKKIEEVVECVKLNNVKYQVGFNRRFDSNFKALKETVLAGTLGQVHMVNITSRDPEPPSSEYAKVSGGMFMDMTIHDFDMARFLSGSEAEEVYAIGTCLIDPEIGKAGDIDTAVITIKMKNGAIVTINNSRKAAYGYDQRAEVFGSKGAAQVENKKDSSIQISTDKGVYLEKPQFFFLERYMQSFADEIKSFIDAIVNNTETPVNAYDGLAPVLIAKAGKKSMELNRPVKISEVL